MPVGIVLAAHSAMLADGVAELARQMAPDVTILPAGGTDEGGIGTSFARIEAAVAEAETAQGVLVLYDLGSAQLTAEMVAELVPGVRLQDAPLVEGAVAAAISAAAGDELDQVAAAAAGADVCAEDAGPAASEATGAAGAAGAAGTAGAVQASEATEPSPVVERTVVLPNPLGLHARPAAALARLANGYDVSLGVGRPDTIAIPVTKVIRVVAAGIRGSEQLRIAATGRQAEQAVAAAVSMAESGFGELEESEVLETTSSERPAPTQATGAADSDGARTADAANRGSGTAIDTGAGAGITGETLAGVPAAAGIAVGSVVHLRRGTPELPDRTNADPAVEQDRISTALGATQTELAARVAAGGAAGEIARAHQAFLADPELADAVQQQLARGAERAWWEASNQAAERLGAQGRGVDLEDLALTVLSHLGVSVTVTEAPERLSDRVLVAPDMLPSQVTAVEEAGAAGLALAGSARTAHAAIIARGLGLPTVLQLGDPVLQLPDGQSVVLDADDGLLHTRPSEEQLRTARKQAVQRREQRQAEREAATARVAGVEVMANVGGVADARAAVTNGADGIGLLRTEFLFLNRPDLPDEDEQAAQLSEVLQTLGDRPATIRTLDVGGDKMLPALALDLVRNGPLGERGLRYGLRHEAMLRTQVRAILRAAQGQQVSLMAPMVTVAEEARAFVRMVTDQASVLGVALPPIGVMVEVPAAALEPAPICAEVDFVSVGTNDLAQYLLAADRTLDLGPWVGRWDHPAVFTTIRTLTAASGEADCPVAVCGELAGDPDAAARLVGLGVRELSMAPGAIPAVKRRLRSGSAAPDD